MRSSGMLSTSTCGASRGAVIVVPRVPIVSVLPFRQADDEPVERLRDLDLAGEARIRLRQRGKAQHARFLRARHWRPGDAQPFLIDIDVAGRAGAFAAAIGVDPGDVVVDRAAHDRQPERHLDPVLPPAIFDIGDLRHEGGGSLLSRQPGAYRAAGREAYHQSWRSPPRKWPAQGPGRLTPQMRHDLVANRSMFRRVSSSDRIPNCNSATRMPKPVRSRMRSI